MSEHEEYHRIMDTIYENPTADEDSPGEGQDRSIKTREQQKVTDFYKQKFVEKHGKEIETSRDQEDQRPPTAPEYDRTKQYHSQKTCSKIQASAKVKDTEITSGTKLHVDSEYPGKKTRESSSRQRTPMRDSETRSHEELVQNEKETDVPGENLRETGNTENNKKDPQENSVVRAGEGLEEISPIKRDDVRQQRESIRDTYETSTRRRSRRNLRTPCQARRR